MIDMLLTICNKIWQSGDWPTLVGTQSLVITLPNKVQSSAVILELICTTSILICHLSENHAEDLAKKCMKPQCLDQSLFYNRFIEVQIFKQHNRTHTVNLNIMLSMWFFTYTRDTLLVSRLHRHPGKAYLQGMACSPLGNHEAKKISYV